MLRSSVSVFQTLNKIRSNTDSFPLAFPHVPCSLHCSIPAAIPSLFKVAFSAIGQAGIGRDRAETRTKKTLKPQLLFSISWGSKLTRFSHPTGDNLKGNSCMWRCFMTGW